MFKLLTAIVEGSFKLAGWIILSSVVLLIYMTWVGV